MLDPRRSTDTDAAPPSGEDTKIVFLAGAIKWWWLARCKMCGRLAEPHELAGECPSGQDYFVSSPSGGVASVSRTHHLKLFWDSPEHREYVAWRNDVRAALIEAGFLTYAPHEAFKGTWTESAQAINDSAIITSSVVLNLSPDYAVTDGTDDELDLAKRFGIPVLPCPPGGSVEAVVEAVRRAPKATVQVTRRVTTSKRKKLSTRLRARARTFLPGGLRFDDGDGF